MTSELTTNVNAEIGDAIRDAAIEVFQTMLALELAAAEPIVTKSVERCPGVVALLGLTGVWSGMGQISCSPEFACRIASVMLMAEYAAVDEDVLDAIAEIANMVVGNIKNALEAKLGPMGLSTPTIVFGGEFDTRIANNPDRVIVSFLCGPDLLNVEVAVAPKHPDSRIIEKHGPPPVAALA